GELSFDGLLWLRNRAYDPSTRGFLSPDPLSPPTGVAWAGNPYSYAGNDPIGSADPLGLRPVTEAELANYRDAMNRSVWEKAGDWVQDNWEYIAAGAMVVAGVVVMATGVGGPIGAAMIGGALLSMGGSTAVQKATTGDVDWGQVAIAGVVGAAAGGAGAQAGIWIGGGSRLAAMNPALRGALIGSGENLVSGGVSRGLTGDDIFNPRAMAGDLLIGGGGGAVGGHLGAGRLDDGPHTTILGENMRVRVTPFAERTGARTIDMADTDDWNRMSPKERYHTNDGSLRKRINEGDDFRYIGQDPERSATDRAKFDLTRSELVRLDERGIPYETVSEDEVVKVLGRK
ncbi:MAG: hypothetical protein KY456_17520, partial [Chloroflexi bacterium]|nr:hypothetical protein [Chloroflexota bacterium]